jgi:hypothetical protein
MVTELNNIENKTIVKRGRPKGSINKHKISLVNQINVAIDEAVNRVIPEKYNTTLSEILADSLKANPTATLQAIGKFVNNDINVNIGIQNPFTEALKEINAKIIEHDEVE